MFKNKASVSTKQKILSSIFKEKLVFEDKKYRTPILNKGIELISKIISVLQAYANKNERQSYDYLPLSTRSGTWTTDITPLISSPTCQFHIQVKLKLGGDGIRTHDPHLGWYLRHTLRSTNLIKYSKLTTLFIFLLVFISLSFINSSTALTS